MNVDVDSHFLPLSLFDHLPHELKDIPRLTLENGGSKVVYPGVGTKLIEDAATEKALKVRINAMHEAGFDKQCLEVYNGYIPYPFVSDEVSLHLCRAWNDAVAKVTEANDCFVGVAQVPHTSVESAIAEAERTVKDLQFPALEVHGTWAGGKNFESREWWPFFEAAQRLDVPLWFHTAGLILKNRFSPWMPANDVLDDFPPYINAIMGFLIHAQIVCSGLIFSGIFDKCPGLKVLLTECDAGWVPSFMDWMDMVYDSQLMQEKADALDYFITNPAVGEIKLRKRPSQYVRDNFSFALTTSANMSIDHLLPLLVNVAKLDRNLVIESDYNHVEGSLDIIRRVMSVAGITDEAKEKICGRNAADLLKLDWEPSEFEDLYA